MLLLEVSKGVAGLLGLLCGSKGVEGIASRLWLLLLGSHTERIGSGLLRDESSVLLHTTLVQTALLLTKPILHPIKACLLSEPSLLGSKHRLLLELGGRIAKCGLPLKIIGRLCSHRLLILLDAIEEVY